MAIPTTSINSGIEELRINANQLATNQGDLADLTTTATSTLVAAINEIDSEISAVDVIGNAKKMGVIL